MSKKVYTNRVIRLDPDYKIGGRTPPKRRGDFKGTTYVVKVEYRRVDRVKLFADLDAISARIRADDES